MSKTIKDLLLILLISFSVTSLSSSARTAEKVSKQNPAILFLGVSPRETRTWNDWLESGFEINAMKIGEVKSVSDLKCFNAVILNFVPKWDVSGKAKPELVKLEKILGKYLNLGGGVVVFCGGGEWSGMCPSVSHLLKPYGAGIREEQVTDPEHLQGKVHHIDVCYTTKISNSPMSENIQRIGYIGSASRADCIKTTQPVVLLKPDLWHVVLRGEKSAYSAEGLKPGTTPKLKKEAATYSSHPIMAAWREVGDGRLFVYPHNVAFTVASPDVFENTLWEKTPKGKKGLQNRQFIMQAVRWAAKGSLKTGNLGGYKTNRKIPFDQGAILDFKKPVAINWSGIKVGGGFGAIKGLIGAQSQYSGGKYSISDLAKAAKDSGLSFLAFTEALEQINPEKWESIKAECVKNSDNEFLAIPGVLARDKVGNLWFAVGHVAFPRYPAISEDGNLIDNTYQFWAKCFNTRLGGFVDPLSNPNPWYEMKHTSGMSVFTWKNGKLTETAVKEYLLSCSKAENYLPFCFTLLNTPKEIEKAKNEILNVFTGKSVEELKDYVAGTGQFKSPLFHASPHKWYLSKGPKLLFNGGYNLGNFNSDEEKQNLFRYSFKLGNLRSGDKILLFDGDDKIREWRATDTVFETEHTWPHEQQRQLIIQVLRNDELLMLSSPVLLHSGPRFNQCGDRQNTLPYNYAMDRNGNFYVSGIPIGAHYRSWPPHTLVYGNFKVWQTGAVGIEAQPPMYMSFNTSPHIPLAGRDMVGGGALASYQYPKLACPGIIIVDEICHRMYPDNGRHMGDCRPPKKTKELEPFTLHQRRYGLYGLLSQVNGQYIESKIIVLKECAIANKGTKVRVSHFTYPIKPGTRKNAEIFANGGITRYPFRMMPQINRTDIMKSGDYVGIYPHGVAGGGAQYAVSKNLQSLIRHKVNSRNFGDSIYITVPNKWKRGDEFKYNMLFTTGGSVPAQEDSDYLQVVTFLGLRDNKFPAISKVTGGQLLPEPVIATIATTPIETLRLATREYPDAPLALPVRARGYNPNWQVVYTLNGSKNWRYCGKLDKDFYFHIYTSLSSCEVVMGHPLTADNDKVVIALDDPYGKQSQFEIYNPTAEKMSVKLKSNASFLPGKSLALDLNPFESRRVDF